MIISGEREDGDTRKRSSLFRRKTLTYTRDDESAHNTFSVKQSLMYFTTLRRFTQPQMSILCRLLWTGSLDTKYKLYCKIVFMQQRLSEIRTKLKCKIAILFQCFQHLHFICYQIIFLT